MPRCNGSFVGLDVAPTASAASGIWTVREAEAYLRANKWPATPTVPGAPSGTPGDSEVALTWTAPTGGAPVTDYIVEYSSDAGATWTTFADGVGTDTSATVTGLTNGTGYIFRITAINALGQGPAGSASGTITPAVPSAAYLLMHFDGNLNDSSANAFTATASGGAAVSTTESKFGGSSLYLNGSSDYLTMLGTDTGPLEDGDYTVEAWIRTADPSSFQMIAASWAGPDGGDFTLYIQGGALNGDVQSTNGALGVPRNLSGGTVIADTWHHVALTRTGNTARLFLDGVMVDSGTAADRYYPPARDVVSIGSYAGGLWPFAGYIDEVRIIAGTAMYDSDLGFTPPTAPFA